MGTVAITCTAMGAILIVALVPLVRRSILPGGATVQVSEQSKKPSQFVRLVLLSLLWAVCLLSTLHFHFSLRQQVIVSHLFYVPIIIASLWWKRWGIPLAVSSGAFLLLSHHFASLGSLTDDIVRSCLFVVVSATVAWLSEKSAQATTRIRESEELFRSVFDGIQDVFFRTDAEGRVILVSPSVQQTTGYAAEEVIGQPASRFYADPAQRDILLEELSQKDTVTDFEINLRHSDGTVIPTSVNSYIMKDDEGRVLGVEGVLRDITERKEAERQLHIYQQRLRALAMRLSSVEEEERRAIAAGLHDDISQTLALCKMRMAGLDESSPASAVASISGEVRGLLEEAISRTRSLTFRLSPPVLYELGFVAAVEWLAEQLEEEHGVVFRIEQNSQLPPIGDEVSILLFRAVRELLINVIKHAQTNTARVSIDRNGDHVRVVVQDAGVGFDMAQLDSRGRPPGFGLFNVRERLNYVGGVLQIESQPGAGTRVAMIVPLKLQEQAATDKEQ